MKKLLLTAAAILAALNMYAQGTTYQGAVGFNSAGATGNKLILDETGAPAAGPGYQAGLYWGSASVTDANSLTQIGGSANFLPGTSAGTFFGGGRTITYPSSSTETGPGAVLTFQVRAWKGTTGSTYDAANLRGSGPLFTLKTKDLGNVQELSPNIYLASGYQGFSIVPEPSVIALGVIGAGALLMLRRRK